MQERPLEPLHRPDVSGYPPMDASVEGVAHDGMTDLAEMHTDLMGAAGVDGHLAERQPRQMVRPRNSRDGGSGVLGSGGHLLPMYRIATNRRVDTSASLNHSPHERQVLLFDLAIVELTRKLLMGRVVLGDDDHARCASIQAMHNAWAFLATDAAQSRQAMQ